MVQRVGNSVSAVTKEIELERMPSETPMRGSEQPVGPALKRSTDEFRGAKASSKARNKLRTIEFVADWELKADEAHDG
jgi:hypothetical protein